MDTPLISIITLAYNHAPYIRQCIEGVVMQKTSFPIEMIIHDDASPDGTADIIREYEALYPDIIKPIYQEENQWSQKKSIFNRHIAPKIRGKYLAMCEGDDYWTDPDKLQKQVEFLEANPDYSASVHQCLTIYTYKDVPPEPYTKNAKDTYALCDLLDDVRFHTATLVYRTFISEIETKMPRTIISGDRGLYFRCIKFGKIKFFHEPMSVYRINQSSISTRVTAEVMKGDLDFIPWLVGLIPDFPKYRYLSYIHKTIIAYPPKVPLHTYLKHYFLYAWYSFSFFPKNLLPLFRFTFLTTPKFAVLRLFPNIKWLKTYR